MDLSFPLCKIGSCIRQSLDASCTSDEHVPKFIIIINYFSRNPKEVMGRKEGPLAWVYSYIPISSALQGEAAGSRLHYADK